MKKIIIVNNNMKVGGVQKSLYNLLWALDGKYEITLLLFQNNGAYADDLPPDVKVLECKSLFRLLGISQGECRGWDKLMRGALVVISRLFGRAAAMKLVLASQKSLPQTYDCAISFLHNGNIKNFYGGTQEFVLHRIRAKKKVAFLHCDYKNCGANHPSNNRLMDAFDVIAACSDGCREAFLQVLPELERKCVTVRNCHRINQIRALAEDDPVIYDENAVNVVMVSRLSHEKGIERAIEAVACALNAKMPVSLHIVGGGPMETQLRLLVAERKLEDAVHFYGEQSNPYRYMKNADLFLMTSFHEAAPMVIEEAAILGVPVLTTKTTSSREMVTEKNSGWVCENHQQALNEALLRLLRDKKQIKMIKNRLLEAAWDNSAALEQFEKLIGETYEA